MTEDKMVHARISRLFLLFLMLMGIAGCQDFGDTYDVDPHLLGDWYRFDTLTVAQPSPRVAFNGMRINADRTIQPLGIEFETGRVALMEGDVIRHILNGTRGLLVVQYFAPPDLATDSMSYAFANETLVLSHRYTRSAYSRTRLGSVLARPEHVIVTLTIDGVRTESPRIGRVIPAYVSKLPGTRIQLFSVIPDGSLTIEVDDFNGAGTYPIAPGKGVLRLFSGDVVFTLSADSLSSGTIHIDQYDEVAGRCSGRFAFTARMWVPPNDPPIVRQLGDGYFAVPLYH